VTLLSYIFGVAMKQFDHCSRCDRLWDFFCVTSTTTSTSKFWTLLRPLKTDPDLRIRDSIMTEFKLEELSIQYKGTACFHPIVLNCKL